MKLKSIANHKKSDTLVIYGCGGSLKEHTDEDWKLLKKFDSIGFNWFILQKYIYNPTYMVVGDISTDKEIEEIGATQEKMYENYQKYMNQSRYENSLFFIMNGRNKLFPNEINRDVHYYEQVNNCDRWDKLKSICSTPSTLFTCFQIAMALKYKKVIFAGVDFYDKKYFFADSRTFRKKSSEKIKHPGARYSLKWFKRNALNIQKTGVKLYSYNHKSLLLKRKFIKKYPK